MFFFIGIKGTGMAALATMLYDLGNEVSGSDLDKHFFTEDELVKRGIKILPFSKDNIKDNMTVIIGNAFLEDFEEVIAARNNKTCKCYRYHEYLGILMNDYKGVCLAGSHGKTTTTTMAMTIFKAFDDCAYIIGDGRGYASKNSEYILVEADEFRRHFCEYHPDYAVINNIEIDHVDYFKDELDYLSAYQDFVKNVKKAVFYYGEDPWFEKLEFSTPAYSFGFKEDDKYQIRNLNEHSKGSDFDLYIDGEFIYHYELPFIGEFMLIDALGVISLSHYLGFNHKTVNEQLKHFEGAKRRYVIEEYKDSIFIDDYAHHPTEVKVTLEATRKRYPDRNIVAIFKPHRASRVKYFVDDFKNALEIADDIYLIDFTSIDDKQDGTDIDISYLANRIDGSNILTEDESGAKLLAKHKGSVYVFMSSKDIYNIAEMAKSYI